MSPKRAGSKAAPAGARLFALLKPYRRLVAILVVLTIAGNGLTLVVPKLISHAIDAYTQRTFVLSAVVLQFFVIAFLVFALNYLQNIVQTYASERVARDLRTRLAAKIATQSYSSIEQVTPAKLLTNLTSDVDAVKLFVSQAVASIISSVFLIIGASVLLLSINWKLGLGVLAVLPVIGVTFFLVLRQGPSSVQARPGSDRLAEQGHQREHPRRGADPAAELPAASKYEKFARREHRGARHQPRHPAALSRPDPGDHLRYQSCDPDDSDARRPLRDRSAP